jgi:hypothetical protein
MGIGSDVTDFIGEADGGEFADSFPVFIRPCGPERDQQKASMS